MVGVVVSIMAITSLAGAPTDGALLGVGLIAAAVVAAAFLLARCGFRLAKPVPRNEVRLGAVMWLVAIVFFVGVIGSMAAFVISSAMTSQSGAGTALVLLLLSGIVTVAGARVLGIASARRRAPEGN